MNQFLELKLPKGPGKRGYIVAHDVSWAEQTGKHLLRTQNVSEQNQKHFLCPGHKICVRNKCCARGQTGKHLCWQQCVLVCQGLRSAVTVERFEKFSLNFSIPLFVTEIPTFPFPPETFHFRLIFSRFLKLFLAKERRFFPVFLKQVFKRDSLPFFCGL